MEMEKLHRGGMLGIIASFLYLAFMGSGEISMIAGILGEGSAAIIGFILFLIGSAVYGAIYTGWVESMATGGWQTMVVGLVYGIIWWIISPNIIVPAVTGGAVLALDLSGAQFYAHIISGVALAWIAEATGGSKET